VDSPDDNMKLANAIALLGGAAAIPAAFAGLDYVVLHYGYLAAKDLSLTAAAAAAVFAALDGVSAEQTFRTSRLPEGPAVSETKGFLERLSLRLAVARLGAVGAFTWAAATTGDRLSLVAGGLGAVAAYCAVAAFQTESTHISGTELLTQEEARRRLSARRPWFDKGFPLVPGLDLPTARAEKQGTIYIGASQTGKTLLLRYNMQTTLRRKPVRAVVYDGKADLLPALVGIGPSVNIYGMNAFDNPKASEPKRKVFRCCRWKFGRDCPNPAVAKAMANVIAAADTTKLNDPFWVEAARAIISGAFIYFQHVKPDGSWGLEDVVRLFQNVQDLEFALGSCPHTRDRLQYLTKAQNSAGDVLKTILNYVLQFSEICAMWEHSETEISLTEFMHGDGILLLPVDETARAPLDTLYRAMFLRLVQLQLRPGAKKFGKTHFYLDEVKEAGRLIGLSSLLVRGFGKGAVCYLTFQSFEGFKAVLGPEAHEVVGTCRNRVVTQLTEAATASVISQEFGKRTVWRVTPAHGKEPEHLTKETKDVVSPDDLKGLQAANEELGMSAYVESREFHGVTRFAISGPGLRAAIMKEAEIDDVVPLGKEHTMHLRPWTEAERIALGLPATPLPPPTETEPANEDAKDEGAGAGKGKKGGLRFDLINPGEVIPTGRSSKPKARGK
jgi:hypothetical protein